MTVVDNNKVCKCVKCVGAALKFRKRKGNLSTYVHVLHKTLNLVISRCCFEEDGKERNAKKYITHVQIQCLLKLKLINIIVF